jgi:hypothetical protein
MTIQDVYAAEPRHQVALRAYETRLRRDLAQATPPLEDSRLNAIVVSELYSELQRLRTAQRQAEMVLRVRQAAMSAAN